MGGYLPRALLCFTALCFAASGGARAAAAVVATAHSIAGGDSVSRVDPLEQTLTISTAGLYHLTLTDLKQPAAFAEVALAVTSGSTLVTAATVAAGGAPADAPINAPAGAYVVHVIGALPAGQLFATAGVQLTDAFGNPVSGFAGPGGAPVAGFTATLSLPPAAVPANARVIDTTIAISAADNYQLDLKDLQVPAALAALQIALADPTGTLVPGSTLTGAGSFTFAGVPGNYHLVGGAQAAAGAAGGLYNIHAYSTTTHIDVLDETGAMGQVAPLGATVLSAGSYQLALTDFAFPHALAQAAALAVQGGSLVANASGGSPASFAAISGSCQVFALAVPDATAHSGAYGVALAPQGGTAVFSSVQATSSGTGGTAAYAYPVLVPSGGDYTLTLTDFQFPTPFATLALAAAQSATLLGTPLSGAGSVTLHPAAGQMFILASGTPGAGGKGLFGVDLTAAADGAVTLDRTQGVGAAFNTTTAPIAAAGSYNVTVNDLAFPGNFAELDAIVTQGSTRLGSILGGGTFTIAATPGNYLINVLGTPQQIIASSTQTAGTYGVVVEPTPPAPTVTLTASAAAVESGNAVTLTWSSTDASDCSASGGWNGALATSGSESSAPITAATTFTLTCSGAGGSASQSVTVNVKAARSQGGGGSSDGLLLMLLAAAAVARWHSCAPRPTPDPK